MARQVRVEIVGDATSLSRALNSATSGAGRVGSAFASLARVTAIAAGAAGVGALVVTLRRGIKEYAEAAKVAAQTNAVITSTGGVANVTAGDVDHLAEALMRKSGVDDEAIKSSENLLLGFTNIRNEVGRGNDVFNKATAAVLDYSVRTGRDASQAAILFGKALNDPIKGLSALTRVGIQFTAAQKDQIKSLVDSGDLMGAQKLVLAELETRYGGAAEAAGKTLPGQLAVLNESFNNLAGEIVARLVPAFQALLDSIGQIGAAYRQHAAQIAATWQAIRASAESVKVWYETQLAPAIRTLLTVLTALWDKFGADITRIVVSTFEVIRSNIQTTLAIITGLVRVFVALLHGDWAEAWDGVRSIVAAAVENVRVTLAAGVAVFGALAHMAGTAIVTGVRTGVAALTDVVRAAIERVIALLEALPGRMVAALGDLSHLLYGAGLSLIQGLIDGIKSKLGDLWGLIGSIKDTIADLKGPLEKDRRLLIPHGRAIIAGLQQGISEGLRPLSVMTASIATPEMLMPTRPDTGPLRPAAATGTNIVVNVSGWVGDEQRLVRTIRAELLRQQSRGVNLGI